MLRVSPRTVLRVLASQRRQLRSGAAGEVGRRYDWSKPPTPLSRAAIDEDDEYEDYYEDEDDEGGSDSTSFIGRLPRRLRRGEDIKLVEMPPALDAALEQHTVPRIRSMFRSLKRARKLGNARADEERLPTVDDFAAYRLDRTYAACHRVLHEASCRIPEFEPKAVLDYGAYLGSGTWAAHTVFPPPSDAVALRTFTAVEPNRRMREAGYELSDAALPDGGPSIAWRSELPPLAAEHHRETRYDLVIAPYSLSSLPADGVTRTLEALWERTAVGGVLAVIDSVTPASVAMLRIARKALREGGLPGARLVAPFPHDGIATTTVFGNETGGAEPFPMKAFQKSFRKGATLELTQSVLESEAARAYGKRVDPTRNGNERRKRRETFGYLLAVKQHDGDAEPPDPLDKMWGSLPFCRILGVPRKRTRHVLLDVLTPSGELRTFTVSRAKAHRRDYRYVRKLREGCTLPMAVLEGAGTEQNWKDGWTEVNEQHD